MADLAVLLALPDNPDLLHVIQVGRDAAAFLESEFGRDESFRGAQLSLSAAVHIRADDPARARAWLTAALEVFRRTGAARYQVAQCRFFLSILLDRPFDRAGLEEARDLFLDVARSDSAMRPYALFLAARCWCTVGKLFRDADAIAKGRATLGEAAKLVNTRRLAREMASEEAGCVSGG
jgi:hypothetical protein